MKHPRHQIISGMAGILALQALSSMIYKIYITQNTSHVTYTWLGLIISAQVLYILYGVLNNSYGIYLPAMVALTGILYILFVKIKNAKMKNMEDEFEYQLIKKNIL